jgi:hypothetical protein
MGGDSITLESEPDAWDFDLYLPHFWWKFF